MAILSLRDDSNFLCQCLDQARYVIFCLACNTVWAFECGDCNIDPRTGPFKLYAVKDNTTTLYCDDICASVATFLWPIATFDGNGFYSYNYYGFEPTSKDLGWYDFKDRQMTSQLA